MFRLIVILSSLSLSGCMSDTLNHYWNDGFPSSEKEDALFKKCFDETLKIMRPEPKGYPGSPEVQAWLREFIQGISQCEKNHKN